MYEDAQSLSLKRSLAYLRWRKKKQEVWCLLRFDAVDETIEIFWSTEGTESHIFVPINPGMGKNTLRSKHGNINYKNFKKVDVDAIRGDHAEEALCNNFGRILVEYLKYHETPLLVEIFLSDSPCLDRSQAAPTGCAAKLIQLVNLYEVIPHWHIYYDQIYNGDTVEDRQRSCMAIDRLRVHPRIEIAETPMLLRG